MLSYQHIYHAGNIVDCQKHAILSALLSGLTEFHYIDTHAGRGIYDLDAREAQKIQEYRNGIDKIWPLGNWPKEMRAYQHLLEDLNPEGHCRRYPGSPQVAYAHSHGVQFDLYELHPQEVYALEGNMAHLEHLSIYDESGWDALTKGVTPKAQPVVFIDPSYEIKNEYLLMKHHVASFLNGCPDAIVLIWYPLLKAERHLEMLDMFRQIKGHNILRTEIHTGNAEEAKGLYGTGMLIVNPPENFDNTVTKISKWLTQALGTSTLTELL